MIDIYCLGVVLSLDVTERSPCISKLGIFYITLSKRTETQEENKEPLESLMRTRMPYFSLNNWRPLSGVFLCHLLVLTHTPTTCITIKDRKLEKCFQKRIQCLRHDKKRKNNNYITVVVHLSDQAVRHRLCYNRGVW